MSAEARSITVAITINDGDHLPDDVATDDVYESIRAAVDLAVQAWYRQVEGELYLACEPDVL